MIIQELLQASYARTSPNVYHSGTTTGPTVSSYKGTTSHKGKA